MVASGKLNNERVVGGADGGQGINEKMLDKGEIDFDMGHTRLIMMQLK